MPVLAFVASHLAAIAVAGRSALAIVLLAAGVAKLFEGNAFIGVVREYRLLPDAIAVGVARWLPWAEVGLAIALVAGIVGPPSSLPAATVAAVLASGLFLGFAAAIGINIARGRRDIDCGCFGSRSGGRLTWWLAGRTVALAATAAAIAVVGDRAGPLTGSDAILTAVLAASTIGLALLLAGTLQLWRLVDINQPSAGHVRRRPDDGFPVIAQFGTSGRHVH